MSLWRFQQEDPLHNMERRMTRLFDNFLTDMRPTHTAGMLMPTVDVSEQGNNYIVHAELPGAKKEDIKINVQADTVTISAETKQKKEITKEGTHYSERRFGRWERTIGLPGIVDHKNVKAKYEDGVLEISCPKGTNEAMTSIKVD
jgi:HSP20 family protein